MHTLHTGGSFSLMPDSMLKEMVDLCHSHGVSVSTGGFIERVLSLGGNSRDNVRRYLQSCKDVGFDIVEVSAGD